jgi:hypothetical protein
MVLPNFSEIQIASASHVQVQTPSISGFGPLKMAAASVACSDPVSHSTRRPLGRSNNPSTPSAL